MGDLSEGSLKNSFLYNDKELWDDADLNWYDYGFRNYDPQIGRFPQLDPLTWDYPELTNYQYASCEPIANIDIDGLEKGSAISFTLEYAGSTNFFFVAPKAAAASAPLAKAGIGLAAQVGGKIALATTSIVVNSEKSAVNTNLQKSHLNDLIVNNDPSPLRLEALTQDALNRIDKENQIENYRRQGLWDNTLSVDEARRNFINFNLAFTLPEFLKIGNSAANAARTAKLAKMARLGKEELKAISSLEKEIAKHKAKLAEYIKNPLKFDNKGFLKNAPSEAVRYNIIQTRINHLRKEIATFQNNIEKILNGK